MDKANKFICASLNADRQGLGLKRLMRRIGPGRFTEKNVLFQMTRERNKKTPLNFLVSHVIINYLLSF